MRLATAAALILVSTSLLAGCGSSAPSPESVVRAWSEALNDGDNKRAASLFAPGAEVLQPGHGLLLKTFKEAVAFNAGLPCSGEVITVETKGNVATATFLLADRPTSLCDAPGSEAKAEFDVVDGKIVVWRQLPSATPPPPEAQTA